MENALQFIREVQPDILLLQEVFWQEGAEPQHLDLLAEAMAVPHTAYAPTSGHHDAPGYHKHGNAVLSRWPITQEESRFYDVPYNDDYRETADWTFAPRNLQNLRVATPGGELQVLNTHGIWGYDGRDNERRLAMAEVISGEIAGNGIPTILAGDFNTDPDTETVGIIERKLTNIYKGKISSTFNMLHKTKPIFAQLTVDMMFASPSLRVIGAECPEVNVSDHRPLVTRFAWPTK